MLRVPILYGPYEYLGESAVTTLYNAVKDSSKACKMDHRQRRFPTHTDNVADIVHQMVDKHSTKVSIYICSFFLHFSLFFYILFCIFLFFSLFSLFWPIFWMFDNTKIYMQQKNGHEN